MTLHILHIEDNAVDCELITQRIESEGIGCEIERVDSRESVLTALRNGIFDVVLCDYRLPSYSGVEALQDVRRVNPLIPFIFVSGTIGEAALVEAVKLGATDYVLKSELTKLVPSIQRALREVEEARRRILAEHLQRALYRIAQAADGSPHLDYLYRSIHVIIKEIMPAENFYIALYDDKADLLAFPYFVDEADEPSPPTKPGKGLTEYVLRTGKSLLCDESVHDELVRSGEAELVGVPSSIWLGVPLTVEKKTIGVMVVQHYTNPAAYGHREREILEYISSQVARAIDGKRTEEKLKKTTTDLLQAQRIGKTGSWYVDLERDTLEWSEEVYRICGRDPAIFKPTNEAFFASVHPDDRDAVIAASAESIRTGKRYEIEHRLVLPDGGTRVVLEQAEIVRNGAGKSTAMLGVVQDITERKTAEEALRLHSQVLENMSEAVLVTNERGDIILTNSACDAMFGYERGELVGRNVSVLNDMPEEESRGVVTQVGEALRATGIWRGEFKNRTKDRRPFTTRALVSRIESGGKHLWVSVQEDITERKSLEEQLRQAQKLESLGTLAGGIAHDFNNLLGIIIGHTALLESGSKDPAQLSKSTDAIAKSAQRGAALVRQLLTFARKSDVTLESVMINDVVREAAKLMEETFPKIISVSTDIQKDVPSIVADATQMHQVLLNLCVNARDAMLPRGGSLSIRTRLVNGDTVRVRFPNASAYEYAQITVADTGTGMDKATRVRIFEPFFTTKETGKGTGLGLATVYGIVEKHKGFIDVVTDIGRGTTFFVYFPIPQQRIETLEEEKEAAIPSAGGSETILFVEDEELLRDLVIAVLEHEGYTILTAGDGAEALSVYSRNQQSIGVVLTDLGLPKLGGEALIRAFKEINPSVKTIVASGHLDPDLKSQLAAAGAVEFMQKPFRPNELLTKVRQVLDQKAAIS